MADNYLLPYTGEQVEDRLESPLPVALGGTGQSAVYQTVTVTPNTEAVSNFNYDCRYYPHLGMVFFYGSYKAVVATIANSWVSVATIPSGYLPGRNAEISMSAPGGATGLVFRSNGAFNVRTLTDRAVNTSVDFSGWWFV